MNSLYAAERTVRLDINYKTVNFTGKRVPAITINNQLPGPTLHFKEGDKVTINVYNHLNEETAVHWHGLLVPWQMDGVLGVTQQGIQPGQMFEYQFTLHQSGTYWYHAHAGLQEQQGLYGAFIIDPKKPASYHYDKDFIIVLSDWSNTNPDQIHANLKKSGDYYSPRFPLQASLTTFLTDYRKASPEEKKLLLDDYKSMQKMRMSIYDLSDVAYDAFLLNGKNPWIADVNKGDVIRLRFIGAMASTIMRVKMPGNTMQMIHVQGNDITPYEIEDFSIAPGETYDVLVKISDDKPFVIYAESIDTLGKTYGLLTAHPNILPDLSLIKAFPEPLPVTRTMMKNMMSEMHEGNTSKPMSEPMHMDMPMHHEHHQMMQHDMPTEPMDVPMHHEHHQQHRMMQHDMPTEPTIVGDSFLPGTSDYKTSANTKYENITAIHSTNDPAKPVKAVIRMELFGYMDRYIWFINGIPEYLAKPIRLDPAQRYRIVFTNNSMMRHPMHIHGHWFILRKDNNAYDPLLHTIEVAPGETITADIDTDASGQWFFHCHMIYHMVAGMSRVFQYSTLIDIIENKIKPENIVKNTPYINRPIVRVDEVRPIDKHIVKHPMAHAQGFYFKTRLSLGADPFNNDQRLTYKGLYGPDYNKLELFINDAEVYQDVLENADIDIFYWHLLNQFWAVKAGVNYTYRPAILPFWQPGVGIEGLMPYFIDTEARAYYHDGTIKFDIEFDRDTQITNNFFIRLGVRSILGTKTVNDASIGSGLNQMRYAIRPFYRIMPGINIFAAYENQKNYGAFKVNQGKPYVENTVTLGVDLLL